MDTILFDGAFGTYYSSLYNDDKNCEFASIEKKDRVLQIHREYIESGVNAIKTNSFGANRLLCEDKETIKKIVENSYEIAKEATKNTNVKVFADIGYINDFETENDYLEITKFFLEIGAKNFLFETMAEFEPLKKSINYIKENVLDSIVIISFAVDQEGWTRRGLYYKNLINEALEYGDYSGLNCYCGPYHIYKLIKQLSNKQKIIAMPNTSYPIIENGRLMVRSDNKEYFSDKLCELYSLNLGSIGGCCGTTPNHIGLFISKLKNVTIKENLEEKENNFNFDIHKSKLLERLENGEKIIACELDSPRDANCNFVMENAQKLKNAGCNLITIADSPLARTRADSFIISAKIKREINIDVLPHLTCRDRNQISIKGTLLGGNIENLDNVLVITGDPIQEGKDKGKFYYSSFSLTKYISELNKQVFREKPYTIACALNLNSSNFQVELNRAKRKIESGANLFLTQPVYTDEAVERLKEAKKILNTYILGGIMPVVSYRNAVFLNNEVYGINIPEKIVEKFKDKDKIESFKIANEFSIEIVNKIKDFCDGFYFMIPLNKVDLICKILEVV